MGGTGARIYCCVSMWRILSGQLSAGWNSFASWTRTQLVGFSLFLFLLGSDILLYLYCVFFFDFFFAMTNSSITNNNGAPIKVITFYFRTFEIRPCLILDIRIVPLFIFGHSKLFYCIFSNVCLFLDVRFSVYFWTFDFCCI